MAPGKQLCFWTALAPFVHVGNGTYSPFVRLEDGMTVLGDSDL
jgi:hypothetical protein